jgi:hypothetical protein
MKNYEPMMESDDIVLMNDKVEPKLYCDGGVPVESKNWYLSSGASNHMTSQREFFEELDESVHGHVVFNQGYVMEIKGRGAIRLQCKTGEQRVWSKVYFVPNLHTNIISLGQFQEEGMKVMSYDDRVKIYEERGNLLTVVKRSKNHLYKIQLEVVCASVEDTDAHVGQQKAVASDEMILVEPEVHLVGSSRVATPSTATKMSEEVDVSMPDSEKQISEAQPECTQTTEVASCDILDKEVVSSYGERSDDKMVVEQHVVVSIALTVTICGPATSSVGVADLPSMMSSDADVADSNSTWPEVARQGDLCALTEGHGRRPEYLVASNVAGGCGSAMHVAPSCDMHEGVILASEGRKLALRVSKCELAATYESCYGQEYRAAEQVHDISTGRYFVEPQPRKCGTWTPTITVKPFLMLCPKTAESTGRPPTHVRLHRVLDLYRENVFQNKNPMKVKGTCECSLSIEEPVKFEEANKKDGWRQAMDKPTAGKSVTWMLEGTTMTMSRMTLARSSWRIWDPGRSRRAHRA